jgi:hypothetical protein
MKTYIVYKHQSRVTGKVYIGITCQNPIKSNRRVLRGKIINKPTAYGYKWKFEDNLDL